MTTKPKNYEPMPTVPPELRERYQTILEVLSGALNVTQGAERLQLARNHFQTIMHRGLAGLIAGLTPKPPGRPPTPAREAELEAENERLRRENERLQSRVDTIDRLLGVASDMIRGQVKTTSRERRPKTKPNRTPGSDPEDPRREAARALRGLGLGAKLTAAVAGISEATLRRWNAQHGDVTTTICKQPDTPTAEMTVAAATIVRRLHGLVGADSLRHSVPGLSRRQAAAIKQTTLTAMEQERIATTQRIIVTQPGVIRGFDAIERYDGISVARALERDIAKHGAPLVWREDRARAHDVDEVHEVLRAHQVIPLHGPPHHPRYYGQLERQNREHRAWLDALGPLDADELQRNCDSMTDALNSVWRRRTLDWRTAAELWAARPPVVEDRTVLREEVEERAARIRRDQCDQRAPHDRAERIAIEIALTKRGYLRQEVGGWC
jgi:hypothetical protein